MKIGLFTDRYLPMLDGVAFSTEYLRAELEKMGHEVYVFAPRPSLRYKDKSKHVIRFPAVKGLFFEDYFFTLFFPPTEIRKIDKLKLDIVHFHTPGQVGLFGAYYALQKHIPLVTTYHTDLYEYVKHYPSVLPGTIALSIIAPLITGGGLKDYRTAMNSIKPERSVNKWNQKIVEQGITMIHNHCDLVIAPSRKIERQLLKWKTESRLEILPTGVDKITTNTREISAFKNKYGIQKDDKVVLFVGRIGTEKNLGFLIRAFKKVAKMDPAAKLVIIGKGDDMDMFKEQAANSGYGDRIIFTGPIERRRLGGAYMSAKIFAFPSLGDTQALTINEAARAGLPVVMMDRDITEVVRQNRSGYIAKNNTDDFAAKVLTLLNDEQKRESMGRVGMELASHFSASHQAAKLLRLYQEVIKRYNAKDHPVRTR